METTTFLVLFWTLALANTSPSANHGTPEETASLPETTGDKARNIRDVAGTRILAEVVTASFLIGLPVNPSGEFSC
ncbi:hypothetical protein HanXRQr2_Chr13g0568001 [Helianthus annuus]|uniref:Uncharacterized protein n=1 Tax=Helianthus annuus TaxID=4232 RepID=A0A251SNT9_HELAN|nr:hypothetical protein HanXRQr2_Chr13g0568001 [Helianthus annuus]KAJ0479333.1 hypothetical protein HanIR_Chr13g0618821 [Helianthus annuus]KAJ0847612.1 hypothetical protein HanPSC8_Chr13g0547241 [Helianthus annuus]